MEPDAEASLLQEAYGSGIEAVFDAMADLFAGRPAHLNARDYVRGLLAPLERKNCATIAEWAGHASPDRLHYLLERAVWDERALRVRLATLAVECLGDQGILIFDETGDLKKGVRSLGVARQYTGTAGRVENAQVTTWAVWSTKHGHALVDYEVFLPGEWFTEGDARLGDAGAPGPVAKRTKGQQAAAMTRRFLAGPAGPAAVVPTGDEVYGESPHLRDELYAYRVPFVLAVAKDTRLRPGPGLSPERVDALAERIPTRYWITHSVGKGAKGEREYAWGWMEVCADEQRAGPHWLLVRRSLTTGELAFYRCWAPMPMSLHALVSLAGARWAIEESFQPVKGRSGLDEHQVRPWNPTHRHPALAMAAYLATVLTTIEARAHFPETDQLDRLTVPETAHLVAWSRWRRRKNKQARRSHYKRRNHPQP
ncbi:IS701 family transposase [Glycomyces buryatensis]|uniref:IS701 family transposase n=1 Tax=Glycomyces buryatensis TaxID=2570927 RepID=A0A4S8Q3P8_9ACTN|nr:IS701 family transposase [Glycomyces buryatensis]THV35249.1 IS701 family transposase [Glycomyces buryatensis]